MSETDDDREFKSGDEYSDPLDDEIGFNTTIKRKRESNTAGTPKRRFLRKKIRTPSKQHTESMLKGLQEGLVSMMDVVSKNADRTDELFNKMNLMIDLAHKSLDMT